MFEIGQMVVCINDDCTPPNRLELNRIYTIRDFCRSAAHARGYDFGIVLEETQAVETPYHCSCWIPERFRPVRKTSIEELRKLVAPIKTKGVVR